MIIINEGVTHTTQRTIVKEKNNKHKNIYLNGVRNSTYDSKSNSNSVRMCRNARSPRFLDHDGRCIIFTVPVRMMYCIYRPCDCDCCTISEGLISCVYRLPSRRYLCVVLTIRAGPMFCIYLQLYRPVPGGVDLLCLPYLWVWCIFEHFNYLDNPWWLSRQNFLIVLNKKNDDDRWKWWSRFWL